MIVSNKVDEFLDSQEGKEEMKQVALANPEAKAPIMSVLTGSEEIKDEDRTEESFMLDSKGCTANVVLIKEDEIFCANAGDSR